MNATILFICIYLFTTSVIAGVRTCTPKFKVWEVILSTALGFVLTPILIGVTIAKIIDK